MAPAYPNLVAEIARRGVKFTVIADELGVQPKTLRNKLNGTSPFLWREVCQIQERFFPDLSKDMLFHRDD